MRSKESRPGWGDGGSLKDRLQDWKDERIGASPVTGRTPWGDEGKCQSAVEPRIGRHKCRSVKQRRRNGPRYDSLIGHYAGGKRLPISAARARGQALRCILKHDRTGGAIACSTSIRRRITMRYQHSPGTFHDDDERRPSVHPTASLLY